MQPQLNGMYVIKKSKREQEKEQENSDILYKRIELEAQIHSMSEIYCKIIEFVEENNDAYTKPWLQIKLKVKY